MSTPDLVYITGPMTGLPAYNYAAFNKAAAHLVKQGYAVLNPASNFEGVDGFPRATYMKHDFFHVLQADLLAALDGWENSQGALAEIRMAQLCSVPIYKYNEQEGYITNEELPNLKVVIE